MVLFAAVSNGFMCIKKCMNKHVNGILCFNTICVFQILQKIQKPYIWIPKIFQAYSFNVLGQKN